MNYLAHAYLASSNKDLLIGNFIADHVHGNQLDYPEGILEGIRMHRRIDTFTDEHPEFRSSKRLFYDGFEKYSGVLVDIYFDHLLAKNFNQFTTLELDSFSKQVYKVYKDNISWIPVGGQRFLEYVISNHVYNAYSGIEGIQTVLTHLSNRIGNQYRLEKSVALFLANEEALQKSFDIFFREAIEKFRK